MRFLIACLVSIDSSPRARFETVRNSCDIRKFGGLSSRNSVGKGTTCTGTSAYNTCQNRRDHTCSVQFSVVKYVLGEHLASAPYMHPADA